MAHEANGPASSLQQQYRAWIDADSGTIGANRESFFTDALIVLDTNVLLDLYRYTPNARNQVLDALRTVAPRLWLPYQVGLEFVRNRRKVIADRTVTLRQAKTQVDQNIQQAWNKIGKATEGVKYLLDTFAADEAGQEELDELIAEPTFLDFIAPWRKELHERIDKLRAAHDFGIDDVNGGSDPILPEVTALYGDRIGPTPGPDELRANVERAVTYRFPNKIPPGYLDAGKPTALQAAGDYLLWEEIIKHVRHNATSVDRVIFVSGDTKEDWYEPAGPSSDSRRPWPSLVHEFHCRSNAELLIMETKAFFEGVSEFLDAEITSSTVEEISRAAEAREDVGDKDDVIVTAEVAASLPPPEGLPLAAYRAARLSSSAIRAAVFDSSHRLFQWWLVGVTRELGLRRPEPGEPAVNLVAVVTDNLPLGPNWLPGTMLRRGEFPTPSVTWIAPWMALIIETSPRADRASLLRLTQRQLALREEEDPAGNS